MAKGLSKSFKKALWVYHCNSGSCNGCDIEIIAALCPRYDAERFGIKLVGTPRHADALLITGPVTRQMVEKVKKAIDIPLIVGGGIRSPDTAAEKAKAGADIVVTGTKLEQEKNVRQTLKELIKAIKV